MSNSIKRENIALTFKTEKRILDSLSKKVYKHTTADQLTLLAFLGSLLTAFSYLYAFENLSILHLANLGVFLHWFGDSLDGRVAKLRGENRPKYGHYVDHILDTYSMTIIVIGLHLTSLSVTSSWLFVSIVLLLYTSHVYLKTSVTGVFEFTQSIIGPTELRIILILFHFVIILLRNVIISINTLSYPIIDWAGYITFVILFIMLLKNVSRSLWGSEKIKD